MAVGDDAQCIYSWRGADFENIDDVSGAGTRAPSYTASRPTTARRPQILALANGVLERPARRAATSTRNSAPPASAIAQARRRPSDGRPRAGRVRLQAHPRPRSKMKASPPARSPSSTAPTSTPLEIQLALTRAGVPYTDHQRREILRAPTRPRPHRLHPIRRQPRQRHPRGCGSQSYCRKSAKRAPKRSTPPPTEHAKLMQQRLHRRPRHRRRDDQGVRKTPRTTGPTSAPR